MAAIPPFNIQKIRIGRLVKEETVKNFSCGVSEIDKWCRNKGFRHHQQNRTKIFCAHEGEGTKLLGFYCLSFAAPNEIQLDDQQYREIYRGNGIPLIYIQYIAVIRSCQRHGLGTLLIINALQRVITVAGHVAFYGVGIRPINEEAASLYQKFGFRAKEHTEAHPLMILPIWTVADLFGVKL